LAGIGKKARAAKHAIRRIRLGRSVWRHAPVRRGVAIERALGRNLPGNFPVIDRFVDGVATSIKSIGIGSKWYRKAGNLERRLKSDIRKLARFQGRDWAGVSVHGIKSRRLLVAIPPGLPNSEQLRAMLNAWRYARQMDVQLRFIIVA
jgi:filamentous hemagglutinin